MAEVIPERFFAITDQVLWDRNRYPELVGSMLSKYGPGPFKVVGLRLHTKEAFASRHPPVFPVAVTIELVDDSRKEFSGEWFVKV